MMRPRCFAAMGLATALTVSAASAQQIVRVGGAIERVDGNTVYGRSADGSAITIKLSDKARITAVLKATFADIKPGDYVGTGGLPQADGTQRLVELRIFPKPQDDGGHFYEGWYK
jgi:hypothetical protein